jgi:hypothetical protein
MSRVTVDNIAVGESCTITSPNSTISSLATATAAVDATNVRQEGIDLRNLSIPGACFVTFEQFPSGSFNTSPAATSAITNVGWIECPLINGSKPEITVNPASAAFLVVRMSVEMFIEGTSASGGTSVREVTGRLALGRFKGGGSYQVVDETIRQWQLGNIPSTGKSGDNDVRQSVHIVYVEEIGVKDRNMIFGFTPMVGTHGGTPMIPFYLSNLNLSASVYRRA